MQKGFSKWAIVSTPYKGVLFRGFYRGYLMGYSGL